jgi:membrane dipeptidase
MGVYSPWPWAYPPRLRHVSEVINIPRGLAARGYGDSDIRKVLGDNSLRLFREVWRA